MRRGAIKNVIVHACGDSLLLGQHYFGRPKCVVDIYGKSLLERTADAFGDARFIIVCQEGRRGAIEKCIESTGVRIKHSVVESSPGGCGGAMRKAVLSVPEGENIAVVWDDIFFEESIALPDMHSDYIGVTENLKCKIGYDGKGFARQEEKGSVGGIFGFFYLSRKPKYLLEGKDLVGSMLMGDIKFKPLRFCGVYSITQIEKLKRVRELSRNARAFNRLETEGGKVLKRRHKKLWHLIFGEAEWYKYVAAKGYANIPKVYGYSPLVMEKVAGKSPHEKELTDKGREEVMEDIFDALEGLHAIERTPYFHVAEKEMLVDKTIDRINSISEIVPNNDLEYFIINGRRCRNLLNAAHSEEIAALAAKVSSMDNFAVIHGDPTFSNTIVKKDGKIVFIDPRGSFGEMKVHGDPRYDFAKVYYSAIGNHESFNRGEFGLRIDGERVEVNIASEGWERTEKVFERRVGPYMREIKVMHALIWLSAAGYVLDDIESVLAAYFNGLLLFENARRIFD